MISHKDQQRIKMAAAVLELHGQLQSLIHYMDGYDDHDRERMHELFIETDNAFIKMLNWVMTP